MAHGYKRGMVWWASYKGPDGKRKREKLPGVATKRDADELANALQVKATRVKAGLETPIDNTAGMRSLLEGFLLHKLAGTSYETARHYASALADIVGQFRTDKGRVWPPIQHESYAQVRNMPRTFKPGVFGNRSAVDITPAAVAQYVEERRQTLAIRTLNIRVISLKALLEWARKGGKIGSNPIAEVSRVGKPARSLRFLTKEQVDKLLAASPEPERTIWLFFVSTGVRFREFVNLRWLAVVLKPTGSYPNGSVRVLAETSKGKRQRDIPLTAELQRRLAEMWDAAPDPEGFVFTNGGGRPWVNNLRRKLRAALKRAGLKPNAVSPHGLRHTFATGLLLNGANVITVSKLLGHKDVTQTLNTYAHVVPDNLQEAMQHLPFTVPGACPQTESQGESQLSRRASQLTA